MKWLIFFIYFNSCHFYHRVYYKLTMTCSPDGFVLVSLNFFSFFFNRSGCLFNCEDHFHFYSLFNGNEEKSYRRLSAEIVWVIIFNLHFQEKHGKHPPFCLHRDLTSFYSQGRGELSGAPKYTFLIENDIKHVIKQYRRFH